MFMHFLDRDRFDNLEEWMAKYEELSEERVVELHKVGNSMPFYA